jgi:hypothetical protein
LGLLTKIFGNPEGGANASDESSAAEQASGSASSTEDPVISTYPKGDEKTSGVRPAVEAPPQRSREPTRGAAGNRRPEHPRMYLRPSQATVDPAVPGSTRRPQISVRPGSRETTRAAPPPPPKRSAPERSRVESPRSDLPRGRARTSEPSAPPGSLPPASLPPSSRPKNALVVSPISLTPEEVQLAPGARPKMPTLLGLGAAIETPPLPLVAPSANASRAAARNVATSNRAAGNGVDNVSHDDNRGEHPSAPSSSSSSEGPSTTPRRAPSSDSAAFDALTLPVDVDIPDDITAPVQLLADFALKLSIGPVSQLWVPEVRRAAGALLLTGKLRHETALAALSARLLSLLPSEPVAPNAASSPDATSSSDADDAAAPAPPIEGAQRDQILHEVSRLAGVLPEWPAPAQDLAEETRRRETRIMRELLTVVDGFKRDQRARLEEQMRLEELASMDASAIAEEFEAPLERASELQQVLNTYRQERQTRAPDVGNALAIGLALEDLARKTRDFDDCDPEQKDVQRLLRLERRRALTTVNLLIAERGELEWLEQVEPLAIAERIERLTLWFERARSDSARSDSSRFDSGQFEDDPFTTGSLENMHFDFEQLEADGERAS